MNKLLIVIDMQNDFITGTLGTKEAEAILPLAEKKITDFDGDVIFTKDTHFENYLDTQEGKHLPVVHCIKDTDGWNLAPELGKLQQKLGALCIEKPTFGSKKLAEVLNKKYGASALDIELIGVCTDICVISNALLLKAFFPEAKIRVDSSCCAGVTPESHQNALIAMAACQIDIK
ncbi:MAG: cysteine hydrolase [Clostridiaceae bacterium]|nr:cysteine hydrolase [Clostridiaceae bacterium]